MPGFTHLKDTKGMERAAEESQVVDDFAYSRLIGELSAKRRCVGICWPYAAPPA